MENLMKQIKIEKITLVVGAKEEEKLNRGINLLKKFVSEGKVVKTLAKKRIPEWGIRPNLPIGAKITLRGKEAYQLLINLLKAKEMTLSASQFDSRGNFSFGLSEYIDIPGVSYDPEIKILGLKVAVTLERQGFRVKKRKIKRQKIRGKHLITKEEAMEFMKKEFGLKIK